MPMATAEVLETPDEIEALASRDPSDLAAGMPRTRLER
jgi:hypothetical protein